MTGNVMFILFRLALSLSEAPFSRGNEYPTQKSSIYVQSEVQGLQ